MRCQVMRWVALIVATLVAGDAMPAENTPNSPTIPLGAAEVDVTPEYAVRLNGYGARRAESEGVAQRIFARALAIGADAPANGKESNQATIAKSQSGPAILITVDNCGVPDHMVATLAGRLARKAGIRRERLVVCSTHTHTAPCLSGILELIFGEPIPPEHRLRIDRYTRELTDKLEKVCLEALANRRPGRLDWAQGKVAFAGNRRVLQSGRWSGFGVQKGGPVDHSLPVLRARDAEGKLIALLANYACHCTTPGTFNQIHGDWAGVACQVLNERHKGAVAMVSIGCGADANPNPRGTIALAEQHGTALADEVDRLLKDASAWTPLTQPPLCQLVKIDLPFASVPDKAELEQRAQAKGAVGLHARVQLERLAKGQKLPEALKDYPVAMWTFGDELAMVFLGGEVVVDYSHRLKRELDGRRLWVSGYSNDVPCYIASRRVLNEGGYEADDSMVYYDRPGRLADTVEDQVVATVEKLAPKSFVAPVKEGQPSKAGDDQTGDKSSAPTGGTPKNVGFPPPKTPAQSLAAIHVAADFEIELVAAEPLVVDPVAFDWGPDGRLWVIEMSDYPNGLDGRGKPGGRVKFLEDDDGDGRYDRATLFMEGLSFPTGIKVWRKGVLVCAAPDIFYAEDTDGDGQADRQQRLYRGFGEGNQQHRVNGLRWGLDNWLHVGNGDSGGQIVSLTKSDQVNVQHRDLRIRPDDGSLETLSGNTQYGINRDDWGNWFGGNNANPIWHYALQERYLRRNPHVAAPDPRVHISIKPGQARVYPRSETMERFNKPDQTNRFTSACSPIIYRDTWLGESLYGNSFVCEPVHNLVHREIVQPKGATFTSRRPEAEQQDEFLASEDNWFRPSMVRTGPDGCLWVSDMYRLVIEHPTWIPEQWQQRLDVRAGDTRGRIYRVTRADGRRRPVPKLAGMTTAQLVEQLESPNGPVRDLAHQMILWRDDKAAVAPLLALAAEGKSPQSRLQALCALDGLKAIPLDWLGAKALVDPSPEVRRHAVRLCEAALQAAANGDKPEQEAVSKLGKRIAALAEDPDVPLRQQVAYTLGDWNDPLAAKALVKILCGDWQDPYLRAAALSSIGKDNAPLVLAELMQANRDQQAPPEALPQVASITAQLTTPREALALFETMDLGGADGGKDWTPTFSIATVLLDVATSRGASLEELLKSDDRPSPATKRRLEQIIAQARTTVGDNGSSDAQRLAATALLGRQADREEADLRTLIALVAPDVAGPVQQAALDRIARIGRSDSAATLLADWKRHSPGVRARLLEATLSRRTWIAALLDAIEKQTVPAGQLDAAVRQRLLNQGDNELRQRAVELLKISPDSDRRQLVAEFRQKLAPLTGDVAAGKSVFSKRCAACHRLDGVGNDVGANLAGLTDRSRQALLTAILDPNFATEAKYLTYSAVTRDGLSLTGIIESETGAGLALRTADGRRHEVARSQLDDLVNLGLSLMPEGLEKDLSPQDLADVIAFVAAADPPRREFPLNHPQVIVPEGDGSLMLAATSSEIFGRTVVLETTYRNLGYWHSREDRAAWTLRLPAAGKYDVLLDYACANDRAGNQYVLSVGEQTITGKVEGTGTWDDYRLAKIGTLDLPQGEHRLEFRSAKAIKGSLLDLRSLRLVPRK